MSTSKRRGPWSSSEDQRLLHQIEQDSTLNWVNIAMQVGSRTPKQCRERYHQNLKHTLSHSPITEEEGALIKAFVERHGRRWADIARQLPGRSDNAVKNWWNGHVNRIKRHNDRQEAKAKKDVHGAAAPAMPPHAHHNHHDHHPHHPHEHQRKSSLHDLVAAANMQRPAMQEVRDAYQGFRPYAAPSHPTAQLPLPPMPRPPYQQTTYDRYSSSAVESRREYGRPPPPPPPAPASYYHNHNHHHHQGCSQPCCYPRQQQSAQEPYAEYPAHHHASSSYPPRPVSSGTSVESAYSRRPSVAYAQSPGADSVDQAPSLVSDHGSPSVRGASSHAWPSPAMELNTLPSIGGSSYKDGQTTAHSSPATQYVYPSNSYARSARPSFSAGSDAPLNIRQPASGESPIEAPSKSSEKLGRVSVRDLLN